MTVAKYLRISNEDVDLRSAGKDESDSIANQRNLLDSFIAQQNNFAQADIIEFCDDGWSGKNFERPGVRAMLEQVKRGKIQCIVVKDLSRFGRNYVETGYYLEKIFPRLGIRFVAVNDKYDTLEHKDGDELVVSLKNLVNDLYARDISRKVRSSLVTKQKNGEYVGGRVAYGYLKSPEDKHKLVIDPETAPVVREIFMRRLEGQSFMQIARSLNGRGIPCPGMDSYLKGKRKAQPSGRGALWQAQVVRKISANPVYAGHLVQGKFVRSLSEGIPVTAVDRRDWIVAEHAHEATVDQDTFDRAQALTQQRKKEYMERCNKYGTGENIFKGLLICRDCGTKMIRNKSSKPSGVTYSFGCRIYMENLGGQGCTRKYVREDDLKKSVAGAFGVQIQAALELEGGLARLQEQPEFQKRRRELADKAGRIRQKISHNAVMHSALFESYSDHTLTEQEYISLKEQYGKEREALKEQLLKAEQEEAESVHSFTPENRWISALKRYRDEGIVTAKAAQELIKCIIVSGYNELEIIWNFQDEFSRLASKMEAGV